MQDLCLSGPTKTINFSFKTGHIKSLRSEHNQGVVLLVDDFMTDFDDKRAEASSSFNDESSHATYYNNPR